MRPWPSTSRAPADDVGHDASGHDVAAGLPADAGQVLLAIARSAIAEELGVPCPAPARAAWLGVPGASFVTLHIGASLRGCIGSLISRRPLGEDVAENARAAAFRDPRFVPLSRSELADITIDVSVLSPATPLPITGEADLLARLRPGVDGVILEYAGRRATFLPQVWAQVSGAEEYLVHLKRKLGVADTFWSDDIEVSRYTVTAFEEASDE